MEIEDRATPLTRQFVLLKHLMPAHAPRQTHWDLMIDFGEKLLTFELHELPENLVADATQVLDVTRLVDHRRYYLDYVGPLAADATEGERGSVQRVAAGSATCHATDATGIVRVQLTAAELRAEVEYRPCAVGEVTQLLIRHWHWHTA